MIEDTLNKIETQLRAAKLSDEKRSELLALAETLRTELVDLEKTQKEGAHSIANFAQASTHELLKNDKDEDLLDLSAKALERSVVDFENSHPRLAQTVRGIIVSLGNMGI
ncbi:DUF4404 family protein [Piscirickettsia salmonis]|uniref:DUF4404 family protein n=1 Tax=Piscirickettsia salmonis TaxID=1238 RepID=UPI0002FA9639|nr:DUF4404 family protein [Piscirickettsia salmonis]APS56194.1 hypothetical protein AVI52_02420 [Piscirickettsia salmonis]ERL61654.1 hypothetical protein K661_01997 [Piscirickettsia salmonis LF-89 = ATCC VR-1361]PEQ16676.1 DUF4404 domain-containing protein [Piscirickettsia salmonis]QGN77477.1 hypothetical protein Psal001_01688 [Piscirickettsia salmonis]QGN81064.1 hypothetical protein Psal002_01710 [Piscirickettsia salmonis]